MAENLLPSNCQKYSLALKARTERKRIAEARKALGNLYPFEIRSILIAGKGKKGVYDVYVSRTEIKKPSHIIRAVVLTSLLLLLLSVAFIAVRYKLKESKANVLAEKEHDRLELESMRLQKEKEERLDTLHKEYEILQAMQYEKIYPRMERIYSAMTKGSTIENISIEKTSFLIEVSTNDAMNVLKNFEDNAAFEFVKMTKTSVSNGKETVTYNGTFSNFQRDSTEFLSTDDELEFYEKKIEAMKERQDLLKHTPLSTYIKNIRNTLHKNNCHEQYIQLHGNGNSAEVEFYVLSSSRSILNFISELQGADDCLIDIKRMRIRNSERQDKIQTTLFFESGIDLKQEPKEFSELAEKKIPVEEISQFFHKKASPKNAAKLRQTPAARQKQIPQKKTKMKTLAYIGLTKASGRTFVLAKDEGMNVIYKLPISQTEIDGDYCMETSSGFQAKVRGEYYEVKK